MSDSRWPIFSRERVWTDPAVDDHFVWASIDPAGRTDGSLPQTSRHRSKTTPSVDTREQQLLLVLRRQVATTGHVIGTGTSTCLTGTGWLGPTTTGTTAGEFDPPSSVLAVFRPFLSTAGFTGMADSILWWRIQQWKFWPISICQSCLKNRFIELFIHLAKIDFPTYWKSFNNRWLSSQILDGVQYFKVKNGISTLKEGRCPPLLPSLKDRQICNGP